MCVSLVVMFDYQRVSSKVWCSSFTSWESSPSQTSWRSKWLISPPQPFIWRLEHFGDMLNLGVPHVMNPPNVISFEMLKETTKENTMQYTTESQLTIAAPGHQMSFQVSFQRPRAQFRVMRFLPSSRMGWDGTVSNGRYVYMMVS